MLCLQICWPIEGEFKTDVEFSRQDGVSRKADVSEVQGGRFWAERDTTETGTSHKTNQGNAKAGL